MKRLFYIVFLVTVLSLTANAQLGYKYEGKIKTGKTPLRVYLTNVGFVLYCAGYDANFNGQKDDGDEPPSLWIIGQDIDDNYYSKKLIDLEFRTPQLPSRSYFDLMNNIFYAINGNSIDTVSLYFEGTEPAAKKGRFISNLPNVTSVSGSLNMLFFSVRKSLSEGYVYVYDKENNKFVDTLEAGKGVQMNEYMEMLEKLFVLNEGTFGKDDGSLQVIDYDDNGEGEKKEYKIGGLPNHFLFDAHFFKIYVTCNTSNNIIIYDISENPDTLHFDLPQYNGPRETTIFPYENSPDPLFAATTYDSKVFVFDNAKEIKGTFEAYGKAESLWFFGEAFVIITPFQKDSYNPSEEITLYIKGETGVNTATENQWKIWPNPAKDYFSLSYPEGIELQSAELINSLGQKVYSFAGGSYDMLHIQAGLPAGVYFLRIEYKSGIKTLPLIIK